MISGGEEGTIHIWGYDEGAKSFAHLRLLEGHLRGVRALVVQENYIWSASMDHTIRVWDINTFACVSILTASENGHTAGVLCLEKLTIDDRVFIASGGYDCHLKIWDNGSILYDLVESCEVCALRFFSSPGAYNNLLIGLSNGTYLI